MAAVTVTSGFPRYNVAGSKRQVSYQISGNSGDTLDVGMYSVYQVIFDPGVITGYTLTAATPNAGQTRITFTATGAFTDVNVMVLGT